MLVGAVEFVLFPLLQTVEMTLNVEPLDHDAFFPAIPPTINLTGSEKFNSEEHPTVITFSKVVVDPETFGALNPEVDFIVGNMKLPFQSEPPLIIVPDNISTE